MQIGTYMMDMKSSAFWAQRSRSHEAEDRFGSITLDPFEWSIAFPCSFTVHSVKIDTVYTTKSYGRFLDLLFHLVCLHTQRSEYICLSEALADQSTPRQSPPPYVITPLWTVQLAAARQSGSGLQSPSLSYVGRLESGPRLVGRIGSGVYGLVCFQKIPHWVLSSVLTAAKRGVNT